jgi:cysteine-rich repeat protein
MRLSLPTALLTGFTFSANLGCKYLCNLIGEDCNPLDDEDEYPSIVATTSDSTQSSGSSTVETPTSTDPSTTAPTTDSTSTSTVTTSSTSDTTMESSDSTTSASSTTMADPCGNGQLDDGEVCDDGNNNGMYGHCNLGCMSMGPYCGDGTTDDLHEACDDGNNDDNDGCPNSCQADHYLVFVTEAEVNGAMKADPMDISPGGLAAADTICNDEASGAGLSGTYIAWLSTDSQSAKDHLLAREIDETADFQLVSSVPVATDLDDLLNGDIINNIYLTADGSLAANVLIWTNTDSMGGTKSTESCGDWTLALDDMPDASRIGSTASKDNNWTDSKFGFCYDFYRLYCFQVSFDTP